MDFDELEREFYEDLNGAITAVSRVSDALHIAFECDHWANYSSRLKVTICCSGVVESTARPGATEGLARLADHPLLWEHSEPHANLYFSSAPSNEFELLGHLYAAHNQLFRDWRSPWNYIHATPKILQAGSGLLACGPSRAVASYRDTAAQFLRCSVVPTHTPAAGNILLLFDECFVICKNVEVLEPM